MTRKKIYVFGINGYIGYHLKKQLNYKKFKIISIRNTFYDKIYKLLIKKSSHNDICINLSSITGSNCNEDINKTKFINIDLNKEICDSRIGKLIFTSTASLYKNSKDLCNEESVLNPTSLYTETKLISENIIKSSNKKYIILRPGICFGGQKVISNNFINLFVNNAVKSMATTIQDMNTFRPYVPVNTVAEVIKKLIDKNIENQVFNVGFNNMNKRKVDLLNILMSVTNYKKIDIISKNANRSYKIDSKKINNFLKLNKKDLRKEVVVIYKKLKNEFQK